MSDFFKGIMGIDATYCRLLAGLITMWSMICGCGSETKNTTYSKRESANRKAQDSRTRKAVASKRPRNTRVRETAAAQTQQAKNNQRRRSLADLIDETIEDKPAGGSAPSVAARKPTPTLNAGFVLTAEKERQIQRRSEAAGFRRLAGRHLVLFTDLPAQPEIDSLPACFDQAVPQWAEYLGIDKTSVGKWRIAGYLIGNKDRFRRTGLLREDLPSFLHGYQMFHEVWVYEQPSAYYRRHLLLHEGVHGIMHAFLGAAGPPWYMEGIAELLATHRWSGGTLKVNYFPRHRMETEYGSRIRVIQDVVAGGPGGLVEAAKVLSLRQVLSYPVRAFLESDPYAWSWAAAAFFDGHPRYQKAFRAMPKYVHDPAFSQQLFSSLKEDEAQIKQQWELFIVNLDYGYDIRRAAVRYKPALTLPPEGAEVAVAADRGWQASGWNVEAGATYTFRARGRYAIGKTDAKTWWCEPNGVTIEYHQNRPLGMLICAVGGVAAGGPEDQAPGGGLTPLAYPRPVGLGAQMRFDRSGPLFFRINENASGLGDNTGQLQVSIRETAREE